MKNNKIHIKEVDTSTSAGEYTGPIELGMRKWESNYLEPFTEFVNTEINRKEVKSSTKNNVNRVVGVWEKNEVGSYDIDTHKVHTIKEIINEQLK